MTVSEKAPHWRRFGIYLNDNDCAIIGSIMGQSKYISAGIAITVIWLAVLFTGMFGSSLNYESQRLNTTITVEFPIVFFVAICAVVATLAVARRAFKE